MSRYRGGGKGWHKEPTRHSLARFGVRTRGVAGGVALDRVRSFVEFPRGVGDMDSKFLVVVPKTSAVGVVSDGEHMARAKEVRDILAGWFGGFTMVEGWGGWYDKHGRYIEESVFVVWTNVDIVDYADKSGDVGEYFMAKKREWGQDSLAVELDGEMFFV